MMRVDRERLGLSVARSSWLIGAELRRDGSGVRCRTPTYATA
jgi:hypothetical protein